MAAVWKPPHAMKLMLLPLNPVMPSACAHTLAARHLATNHKLMTGAGVEHMPSTTLGAFCRFSSPCPSRPYLHMRVTDAAPNKSDQSDAGNAEYITGKNGNILATAPRVELAAVGERCGE
jgi:hypothetical protein